ncbi:MAG: prepilin peptidase CpaA [Candidatus Eremiobacteraeota bacterium]|jgi:prepilin peptidase CpaA|nr:prepilin peptidase CpaA [Candidatus Eremiobacteraeota bacterium]
MGPHAAWIVWVIVCGATTAAFFDIATRRIPNWLPAAILIAAVVYHAGRGGWDVLQALSAAAVLLVLGTLAHSRRWFGGGDVKLTVAVAAAFGFPAVADFVLYALVSGGALALVAIVVAQRRSLGTATRSFALVFAGGSLPSMNAGSLKIPYAVAIACGAALTESATAIPALRIFA